MPNKDIKFIETAPMNFEGFTLIEGFPGMGLVGTIGAKYIAERLKMKEVGYIDANIFVPIIRIHDGLPVYPSRIYASEELKLGIIISEQIIPRFFIERMAKAIVEWINEKKFKRLISLEGINSGEEGKQEIVYGIAANEKSKKILEEHKIKAINEGITTGITSLMLLELKRTDMDAISILGNVNMQADYKAAASLIRKLNEMLGLKLSIEPLMKEAMDTERELLKNLDQMKKTHESVQKFEDRTPMYT